MIQVTPLTYPFALHETLLVQSCGFLLILIQTLSAVLCFSAILLNLHEEIKGMVSICSAVQAGLISLVPEWREERGEKNVFRYCSEKTFTVLLGVCSRRNIGQC